MSEVCGDNRFELIGEFKGKLVEDTNIETSPEEMAVLDNILFRFWQMGWLDKLKAQEPRVVKISELTSGEPMLVWLEDIDKDETVAGMIFDYVPGRYGFKLTNIGGMDRIYPLIEEYLTRWRCWTSRPDQATREATPWED